MACTLLPFLKRPGQGWEAAVCPLGGLQWNIFNSRPPKVCEACWTIITSPFRYVQIKSQRANLRGQAPYASLGSCSPIFVFPQEGGDYRNPDAKIHHLRLVGPLGSIFCPSQACCENDFEKTSKKVRKSRILASQNPPKTLPKST